MRKTMKRAKKTAPTKKAMSRAKKKSTGHSATPSRAKRSGLIARSVNATAAGAKSLVGTNLVEKATRTLKNLLKPEAPPPVTSVNLLKPEDPAHSPGHRHLNLKESKGRIPAQKAQRGPQHAPLKIP